MQWIVKRMPRAVEQGDLNITARSPESLCIFPGRGRRDVIVSGAMKNAHGMVRQVFITNEPCVASWIEGDVRGILQVWSSVFPLKALHARIERRKASLGKAHHTDPRRINPRV